MVMVSFRTKKDKEHLLEKAKKMEEYSSMIVECLEDSDYMNEYDERSYRGYEDDDEMMNSRYGYRRYRRM
jgi:hypothetical protein